jgi:hypothetical protein
MELLHQILSDQLAGRASHGSVRVPWRGERGPSHNIT